MAPTTVSTHTTTDPLTPRSSSAEHYPRNLSHSASSPRTRQSRRTVLRLLFWLSIACILASLLLAILVLVSGTSTAPSTHNKAGHTSILLQSLSILSIPINYPFLCPNLTSTSTSNSSSLLPPNLRDCTPQWSIKLYLNAAWAYRDVQGDYTPTHLLWKSFGKPFNISEALVFMDSNLELIKLGGTFADHGYEVPTQPALGVHGIKPVQTRVPAVLLVFACVFTGMLFGFWVWEACLGTRSAERMSKVRRDAGFLVVVAGLVCELGAAVYVYHIVSMAVNQLKDNEFLAGGGKIVVSGERILVVLGLAVALQGLGFVCIGLRVWVEGKMERGGRKERGVRGFNRDNADMGLESLRRTDRWDGEFKR